MEIKELNKDTFNEEVINSKDKVLVDFWASWCGPCRMFAPIMEEIANEGIKVYKVNVDDEEELASNYSISSIPCVIAFENGKEINRSIGLKDKESIKSILG